MDDYQTTPQTPESSSNPTPLPEPEPATATPPPLHVKDTSSSPTPSSTTTSQPSATAYVPDPVASGTTPSSEPSEPAAAVKLNSGALGELARGLVLTASMYLHSVLARTDAEKAGQVWIADDEDQAQIGDPLAGVVQRKGVAAGVVNRDMAAVIEAGIGVAAYAVKNVKKMLAARRLAKQQAGLNGGITSTSTGEPA